MQLTDLFNLIQRTLSQQGFKLTPLLQNSMTTAHFVLSDTDIRKEVVNSAIGDTTAWYGNWLEVREVSRRNGSKYNTSYYLDPRECIRSSSHTIPSMKKAKLKCDQTEPTLIKKITKFALEYKNYLNEQILEKAIDQYLDEKGL